MTRAGLGGSSQRRLRPPLLSWSAHPILLAAYPVLFLFSHNLGEQDSLAPLIAPLIVVVVGAVFLLVLLRILLGDRLRAALVTTAFVIFFFSYGHVYNLLGGGPISETVLLGAWSILAVTVVVVAIRFGSHAVTFNSALNVVALVLVGINVLPIAIWRLDRAGVPAGSESSARASVIDAHRPGASVSKPDIYFIVPDRYPDARTLMETYGYDNTPFLDALRARGFYVAENSTSNYLKTVMSLAATLNLNYLDGKELETERVSGSDSRPIHRLIRDGFEVERFLHSQGYTYVHIASWWDGTAANSAADVTYRHESLSDFSTILYDSTMLRSLGAMFGLGDRADLYTSRRAHVLHQLDKLEDVDHIEGPKFVFAHLTLPHDPYVVDENGRPIGEEEARVRTEAENFTDHVKYVNKRLLSLFDRLLEGSERDRPVIVLQADEGPYPRRLQDQKDGFAWRDATVEELHQKFRILTAVHMPSVEPGRMGVYSSMTPVNTFRAVFNAYFGTNLPRLPDRNFAYPDGTRLYDFFEVTRRVRGEDS